MATTTSFTTSVVVGRGGGKRRFGDAPNIKESRAEKPSVLREEEDAAAVLPIATTRRKRASYRFLLFSSTRRPSIRCEDASSTERRRMRFALF